MSIEALLAELNTNLAANTAILQQVVAGQSAALAKVAESKPATRSRKAAEPAASAEPTVAEQPAAAATEPTITDDEMRDIANGWLKETDDKEERGRRGAFLKEVLNEFGAKMLVGDDGIQDQTDRKKARFFLLRKREGLPVDFGADYDFDGAPTQGNGEPEPADDDDNFIG